jgi:hypothetical protein
MSHQEQVSSPRTLEAADNLVLLHAVSTMAAAMTQKEIPSLMTSMGPKLRKDAREFNALVRHTASGTCINLARCAGAFEEEAAQPRSL